MNSTDFALRSFAKVRGIQRQADVKRFLRRTNMWLLEWGDTHGRRSVGGYDLWPNLSLFCISPGRFFAAIEIKALLAYIVTTYDIKLEEGKSIPRERCFAGIRFPPSGDVMFRARQKWTLWDRTHTGRVHCRNESAWSARISRSEICNTFTWTQISFDAGMMPATNPSVFQHALAVPLFRFDSWTVRHLLYFVGSRFRPLSSRAYSAHWGYICLQHAPTPISVEIFPHYLYLLIFSPNQ